MLNSLREVLLTLIAPEETSVRIIAEDGTIQFFLAVWDGFYYTLTKDLHHAEADGPALIIPNRLHEWYDHGKLHRVKGPARESLDGGPNEWFLYGIRHRIGGPAIEYPNGEQAWYLHGKRHNDKGPAVVYNHNKGITEYWLDGVQVSWYDFMSHPEQ